MSAMNLLDMIMQAQGGGTAQQAGAQLGLNPQQSQSAIAALLPAISSALKQNTGRGRQQRQQQAAHQNGLGMIGKMLDADGDGNSMDDILGMIMKR